MKAKLIISNKEALNPSIDRMINNFINDGKHILTGVSSFNIDGNITYALITYKEVSQY